MENSLKTPPLPRFPVRIDSLALQLVASAAQNNLRDMTELERLALICSDIGRACDECSGHEPTEQFIQNLAHIALRIIDLAHSLQTKPSELIARSVPVEWQFDSTLLNLAEIQFEMERWIRLTHQVGLGREFDSQMSAVFNQVLDLAQRQYSLEAFYEALSNAVAQQESNEETLNDELYSNH